MAAVSNIDTDDVPHHDLSRITLAALKYESAHQHFPTQAITSETGVPLLSWRVRLLPFLGEENLYNQFDLNESWDRPTNLALLPQNPIVFARAGIAEGFTPFLASVGADTLFTPDQQEFNFGNI